MSLLLFLGLFLGTDLSSDAAIRAHVRFLADDLLEGREATAHGQKVAGRYIGANFEHFGLKSFYPDSETPYLHAFNMYSGGLDAAATYLSFAGQSHQLDQGFEFVGTYAKPGEYARKLVFVGFGYRSNKRGFLDYEDMDLTDTIVAFVDGYPPHIAEAYADSDRRRTHLRKQKLKWARKSGAAGVIILAAEDFDLPDFTPESKEGADWLEGRLSTTPLKPAGVELPIMMVKKGQTKAFLGKHYDACKAVIEKIRETSAPASYEAKGETLKLVSVFSSNALTTENVVGYVEGTDPVLKDEYIVLSAHYDHLGIHDGQIFNGADDNASGTALLIDLARRFANAPTRRSIVFLALTAEEKGLIGSRMFLDDAPMPLESIAANINIDMVGRNELSYLGLVPGANKDVTSMNQVAEDINMSLKVKFSLSKDMDRYHHRSDHYNFVRRGIPAIFLHSGDHVDYHKASDTWEKVNYEKIVAVGELVHDLMRRVADDDTRPHFLEPRDGNDADDNESKSEPEAQAEEDEEEGH